MEFDEQEYCVDEGIDTFYYQSSDGEASQSYFGAALVDEAHDCICPVTSLLRQKD